ncbi:MAG: efflux RND transporter permease subunit [Bacteroidales bacterium]|nr:efflux RND transporter permease subunit [Bacteroidales bacterium]
MLNKIIKFSLENKLLVLVGAVLLVIGGYLSSRQMDIDVFPDLTAPTVVVMTDAHRMAAEEVERLVTFPIETSMNGATNVRRVRSASMMGYSFVWVEFDWGMDVFKARQIVSEKMVTLSDVLPEGITPVLAPQSSVMGEILFVGLQSDTTSMMDLRTLAEWVVKPAVLATGGVSQVTIIGGDLKQYQIIADPIRMNAYGVTMDDLEAVGKTLSVNSVGGVVRDFGNEYALRGMGRTNDIDELGKTFVKYAPSDSRDGASNYGDGARSVSTPIVLSDVADIRIGSAVKMGYASHNAKDAIILSISKQPNINTLEVTKNIEKNLVEIQKSLPADVKMDTKIFRQADFIEASVNNVAKALIEGAIFVIIILFLFLGSFRTTVISVLAIPLSLLGTLIVLNLMGMNINTMTLGGMCIAIGSLVDDAIIDVENVYKRLRQNHLLPKEQRESTFSVVFHGSSEIRTSIINATFITIVAFVPLFFLSGMEGRMLKPLGISYIIALLMSLVVAMTVTPLLCKMLLSDEKYLEKQEKESWLSRHLMRGYSTSLDWSLNHKKTVIFSTLALLIIAVCMFFAMGQSFLPDFNEGSLTITAISKPGISLEESNKLGNVIENELLAIPEVNSTARRSGRGELDEHSQATNAAEIDVNFTLSERSQEEFLAEVRHRLSEIPGIAATVGQPLGHRIDHMLTGTRAAIAIKIFGTDISELFMTANRLKDEIADIEGLVDLSVEQQTETPEIQIRANRDMLARYGITMEEFNHFVELAFSGEKLSEIYEGQRSFDLVLRLDPSYTENIEKLKSALISTGGGAMVPLEEVADIVSVGGPNSISRENVQRKIVVSANVSSRDVVSVVNDIKERVDEHIALPEGYRIEYGGQFQSAKDASKILLIMTLVALVVIFLLLYGEFKNVTLSAITLLNLPLAVIGGVFAIYISSAVVSIPAIIGFITLFGIATRNGILLISRYQVCENKGESLRQAIIDGSKDRLNPILMTALTSALALIPLVLNGDASGNEIQSPMAVVVLGGLLTSTLLNIYVIPVVYELINRKK